ncbi:hypothetical protein BLNAU_3115 [Blattamonas nauphoetae]|uniref:Protein kinase domain-containing protein n=1 Tax=Blattamonas nauphoetae TaxID=2049346 RepID=A0ABQ9YEN4_9EUKA|nr:hypothetical protein BLNAU_3115 [Blattamonas nauphoetae]
MISVSLLFCLFQSILTVISSSTDLSSLLDTIPEAPAPKSYENQRAAIIEGTYIGYNIEIMGRCLHLLGERNHERSSPGTHILPQSEPERSAHQEKFNDHTIESCIFSLTNSTMTLESFYFSLVSNSHQPRREKNELRTARLAVVSDSKLTISQSRIEVSPWTSSILISPSTSEESGTESSILIQNCSISSENDKLRGLVETPAFPDCGASRSISLVGCSFNSQTVLGTDGIDLSLIGSALTGHDEVGMISSSLISCSVVNMSSIGSSHQPYVSELSQTMLGCVVSLSSSHLSGSTIRDMNNGGSILCSNSSFSCLLSSPDPNPESSEGTVTLPNDTTTQFDDDGTPYFFDTNSGNLDTSAIFSHCHFTGDGYTKNQRAITFSKYPGTISILSCSFANHTFLGATYKEKGGAVSIDQESEFYDKPITIKKSNFTNLKTNNDAAGVLMTIGQTATVADCRFEKCGPAAGTEWLQMGGLSITNGNPNTPTTIQNLVFDSCSGYLFAGGMYVSAHGLVDFSDCAFNDCAVIDGYKAGAGGFYFYLYGSTPTEVTRMTFTDCWGLRDAGGLQFGSQGDLILSDLHFFGCRTGGDETSSSGGGCEGSLTSLRTLTIQGCSFIECWASYEGGAIHLRGSVSTVITDCLVKDCYSDFRGAIRAKMNAELPTSMSFTRVAFVNNSIGPIGDAYENLNSTEETITSADVALDFDDSETTPPVSIVDCYTTCPKNSIAMHMVIDALSYQPSYVRMFPKAFDNLGPLLKEKVVVGMNQEVGRVELEVKGKMPIASQKYEVTVQKEGDKTEMKGEIEFVDGKGILTSPSQTFNLDFSTSYTITSIVGIVLSSCSSLSNDLTFPLAAWAFNLVSTPSFVSFTTPAWSAPTPPTYTLIGATAHLVSSDKPLAFIILVFNHTVSGSYDFVVEERGKDVTFTVVVASPATTAETKEFDVVGDDRILTHDTTYTIKSISATPGTESTPVVISDPVIFNVPKSEYDPKKARITPEMKKLLSWLIPLVVSLLVALIVVIVLVVLLRRRLVKSQATQKEMEAQEPVELEKVEEVGGDCSNAAIHPEAINHSNFRSDNSLIPTEGGPQQSSKGDSLAELVEVMKCSGDFAVSTARMDTTLYSVLHTEKKEIRNRVIGIQIVNGLKLVVAHRGWSDVLTQLSPHWILLDSAGNVQLKLQMNSNEAEQVALLAQKQQNPNAVGAEGAKSGMDGLRWRAPEVAAGSGQVDGHKASVFSLGLILWEIETGLIPFGEVDAIVAQKQSGTGITPKLSDLHDDEFVALLVRCLSVNPKDRPTLTEIGDFLSSHKNESAIAESKNEMKAQVE